MLDDIPRNLEPAHALGMTTILIKGDTDYGSDGEMSDHIHHRADDLVGFLEDVLEARGSAAPEGTS